jgi:hypothetical protein
MLFLIEFFEIGFVNHGLRDLLALVDQFRGLSNKNDQWKVRLVSYQVDTHPKKTSGVQSIDQFIWKFNQTITDRISQFHVDLDLLDFPICHTFCRFWPELTLPTELCAQRMLCNLTEDGLSETGRLTQMTIVELANALCIYNGR